MNRVLHTIQTPLKQQGATLIVGLIMLALLTVVGLAAMDVTTVDVKIVANSKDRQLAFNGAESALFNGGEVINDYPTKLDTSAAGFVGDTYSSTATADTWWSDDSQWSLTAVSGSSATSQYIIEEPLIQGDGISLGMGNVGPDDRFGFYPTTAKSSGPGNAVVVLQSHFVKKIYQNTVN